MRTLLVDGMSILYRAFYRSRVEYNSHNEPINALRQYLVLLDIFYRDYPCDDIIICEDAPRDTLYRQKMFTGYKAGRSKPPDDLITQKKMLFGFLRKIGFPVVGVTGYEADDIIGTLSKSLSESGEHVIIASSDKDMYQLLTNNLISQLRHNSNNRQQSLLYRDDIFREHGYWPEQVIDQKILLGDSSDNIPGVPGCTAKMSVDILQKYGTLEQFRDATDVPEKMTSIQCYIKNHQDVIDMHRDIITINRDIDIDSIGKQLAYQVTKQTFMETMNRYQVIGVEDFYNLELSNYIISRLLEEENHENH